jgi:hypothetical protein
MGPPAGGQPAAPSFACGSGNFEKTTASQRVTGWSGAAGAEMLSTLGHDLGQRSLAPIPPRELGQVPWPPLASSLKSFYTSLSPGGRQGMSYRSHYIEGKLSLRRA